MNFSISRFIFAKNRRKNKNAASFGHLGRGTADFDQTANGGLNKNIMVIGGAGSGKGMTRSYVLPNIMGDIGGAEYVINDPKEPEPQSTQNKI